METTFITIVSCFLENLLNLFDHLWVIDMSNVGGCEQLKGWLEWQTLMLVSLNMGMEEKR